MLKKEEILEAIGSMSVLDLSELIKSIEEKFNVSATIATVAPVAGAVAGGATAEAVEEKTEFNVILTSFNATKKIAVIKSVREITSLGLKDAKDVVEGAPKTIKEGVSKEEAETVKKKLEDAGGTIEIK